MISPGGTAPGSMDAELSKQVDLKFHNKYLNILRVLNSLMLLEIFLAFLQKRNKNKFPEEIHFLEYLKKMTNT